MTRDEAIAALKQCSRCWRWVTVPICDHCWVDQHRCPPTLARAQADLTRATELLTEAKAIAARLTRFAEGSR
jgi:hypothetical protein